MVNSVFSFFKTKIIEIYGMAADSPDRYPFVSDVPETKSEAQKEVHCVYVWIIQFFKNKVTILFYLKVCHITFLSSKPDQ